jgi:GMP synthase (glutamine-hydrolysing)
MSYKWIAILDFGSPHTQLIARRIREQQVYSEIVRFDITAEQLRARMPSGIILSGSVAGAGNPRCDPAIFGLGIPVLGIGYGMNLMAQTLGGTVTSGATREDGNTRIEAVSTCPLFVGFPETFDAWTSCGDHVATLPSGFQSTARSSSNPNAAMCDESRKLHALQFHPEVTRTQNGTQILRNFLFGVCGCDGDWQLAAWADEAVESLKRQVGDEQVVLGLSGGVDSSVVAMLLHKAIGDRLHCIFVDHGLLRYGEDRQVEATFRAKLGMDLHVIDAKERFYAALKGVTDPEQKRKIIGRVFIDVFAEQARKFKDCKFLGQGTIYPDVIESISPANASHTVKSHHNVGGLPPDLKFELVEPLRELFKDEVRAVGRLLGLADELLTRQPFPGPGLGVRILGEINAERVALLQQADIRVQEEMRKLPGFTSIWQSFAILLPLNAVGVTADGRRTYENVCALRVVDSVDAMTADWTRVPYDTLACISNRIINEVDGINRVVFDISSKPPATIEWE